MCKCTLYGKIPAMKVLIGIVEYKPDAERLKACLKSVSDADTYIVDNSENNIGIASALKKIMEYAGENGYEWVLTLDQDSVAAPGLIDEYLKYTDDSTIGALTCIIKDRNFDELQPAGEVDCCITSGCFMRVDAYKKTPGYDEWLFIDSVDFDICLSLREAGYRIRRIPFEGLIHEVGKGKKTVFGYVYNHPAWRKYYIARNRVYVAKKHGGNVFREIVRNIRDMFLVLLYEDDKLAKIKALAGICKDVCI